MSGLLRRIRRPGAAEETGTEPTTALPDPARGSAPESPATGEDGQRLPAGVAPEDAERRGVTTRRRGLRRRARFLRRARELALRDLGGIVYEARRRQQDGGKVLEEKLQRLAALDAELNGLEDALGTPRGATVIREPGIGGTCARCGELHASDARFCARCGVNLEEAAREAAAAEAERRRVAAENAEAERKAEAEKAGAARKAEAEKAEAARQPAAETPDGETAEPAPAAAGTAEAERTRAESADHARSGNGVPDTPSTQPEQQPTAVDEPATQPLAEPATTPDRPA
jgi:hypothetical protein